jgi:uncharacterized membrane protein
MNQQTGDASQGQQSSFSWLSLGPAVIPAIGVLLYGALNIAYSLFYGRLGVSPEDVGLGYATTLSRSTGFVLVVVLGFVFGVSPLLWQRQLRRQRMLAEQEYMRERELRRLYNERQARGMRMMDEELSAEIRSREQEMRAREEALRRQEQALVEQLQFRRVVMIVSVTLTLFLIIPTMVAPLFSMGRANAVRAGIATAPVRALGLTLLDVHADPATIRATGKPGETAAIDALHSEKLLYLGQANGISVFFNSSAKQAIYIPSSSIVLRVEAE